MNVKSEILHAIRTYARKHKGKPRVIELSWYGAFELCELGLDELGPDLVDELISEGPEALVNEKLFGCEMQLMPVYDRRVVEIRGGKPKGKPRVVEIRGGKPKGKPKPNTRPTNRQRPQGRRQ
jgi:hypothetical protein